MVQFVWVFLQQIRNSQSNLKNVLCLVLTTKSSLNFFLADWSNHQQHHQLSEARPSSSQLSVMLSNSVSMEKCPSIHQSVELESRERWYKDYCSKRLTVVIFVQLDSGSNVVILLLHWAGSKNQSENHFEKRVALEKWAEYVDAMRLLEENWNITENLFTVIKRMLCHLYEAPEEDVNDVGYKIFCRVKTPNLTIFVQQKMNYCNNSSEQIINRISENTP